MAGDVDRLDAHDGVCVAPFTPTSVVAVDVVQTAALPGTRQGNTRDHPSLATPAEPRSWVSWMPSAGLPGVCETWS